MSGVATTLVSCFLAVVLRLWACPVSPAEGILLGAAQGHHALRKPRVRRPGPLRRARHWCGRQHCQPFCRRLCFGRKPWFGRFFFFFFCFAFSSSSFFIFYLFYLFVVIFSPLFVTPLFFVCVSFMCTHTCVLSLQRRILQVCVVREWTARALLVVFLDVSCRAAGAGPEADGRVNASMVRALRNADCVVVVLTLFTTCQHHSAS